MEDHNLSNQSQQAQNATDNGEGEDFAALFESQQQQQDAFVTLDSRIEGTIVSIGEEWVFVDVGGKTEGAISREELLDEHGQLNFKEGDSLTAYVVKNRDGEILLSVKMTAAASEEAMRGAQRSGVPVEGLVVGERKGGYTVTVLGKQGFCPYSQIDLQPAGSSLDYIGKRLSFRITEFSDRGRNVVLSRREILEEERLKKIAQLRQTLKPGDVVEGVVRKLAPFGAFVDIGGVEGLVPMSELAWHRVAAVTDILNPGDTVRVLILDLDWDNKRISLSLKQTLADPWESVEAGYQENQNLTGTVTRLMNFGAFVELEPGIEGLIHISQFGTGKRINHPREILSEGDQVKIRIISVDSPAKRIGLELITSGAADPVDSGVDLKEGDVVVGTVDSVKEYGVFVRLPGGKSGLIHVSEMATDRAGDMRNRFPIGSEVEAQIMALDQDTGKISLSTKRLANRLEDSHFRQFATATSGRASLGTLGDLLKSKGER
jgi:small subunit ribosomal protein S1